MKEKIRVTVIFPQTFEIEVDRSQSEEQQRKAILDHAGYLMETSQSEPVIHDCSDPEMID